MKSVHEEPSLQYREQVQIYEYPNEINSPPEGIAVTLGDLHGNAAKFLHLLVREGIIDISENDYNRLIEIYKISNDNYNHHDFVGLLSHLQLKIPCPKLRLVGDDLADRGKNDTLTLEIFKRLDELGANMEVIASNHGIEFLKQYAYGLTGDLKTIYQGDWQHFGTSLHELRRDIEGKVISLHDVEKMIDNNYLPHLKMLSYQINSDNEITIYSHAPISNEKIKALAKIFSVPYNGSTVKELASTIDLINDKWLLLIKDRELLKDFFNKRVSHDAFDNFINDRYDALKSEPKSPYEVINVHGHVGTNDKLLNNIAGWNHQNLDNDLGKGNDEAKHDYCAYISKEPLLQLNVTLMNQDTSQIEEDNSLDNIDELALPDNNNALAQTDDRLQNYSEDILTNDIHFMSNTQSRIIDDEESGDDLLDEHDEEFLQNNSNSIDNKSQNNIKQLTEEEIQIMLAYRIGELCLRAVYDVNSKYSVEMENELIFFAKKCGVEIELVPDSMDSDDFSKDTCRWKYTVPENATVDPKNMGTKLANELLEIIPASPAGLNMRIEVQLLKSEVSKQIQQNRDNAFSLASNPPHVHNLNLKSLFHNVYQAKEQYIAEGRSTHKNSFDKIIKKIESYKNNDEMTAQEKYSAMVKYLENALVAQQASYNVVPSFFRAGKNFADRLQAGNKEFVYPRLLANILEKVYDDLPLMLRDNNDKTRNICSNIIENIQSASAKQNQLVINTNNQQKNGPQ